MTLNRWDIAEGGFVSWTAHRLRAEDGDGVITAYEASAQCKAYYVDSESGGVSETGSGTAADPWVNLNTVFESEEIADLCQYSCCPSRVVIYVKGTIDYQIRGDNTLNGEYGARYVNEHEQSPTQESRPGYFLYMVYPWYPTIIIEPWGSGRITIAVDYAFNADAQGCIQYLHGVAFKKVDLVMDGIICDGEACDFGFAGYYACSGCYWDDCTISFTGSSDPSGVWLWISGMHSCAGVFNDLTITMDQGGLTEYGIHFSGLDSCDGTFLNVEIDVEAVTMRAIGSHLGRGKFYNCTITAHGSPFSVGVWWNDSAGYHSAGSYVHWTTYRECTITASAVVGATGQWWMGYAWGFGVYECGLVHFLDCVVTGSASGGSHVGAVCEGYGFNLCDLCTYHTCTGNGYATASDEDAQLRACGWYQCDQDWDEVTNRFYDCTESDPVCSNFDCGNFECSDITENWVPDEEEEPVIEGYENCSGCETQPFSPSCLIVDTKGFYAPYGHQCSNCSSLSGLRWFPSRTKYLYTDTTCWYHDVKDGIEIDCTDSDFSDCGTITKLHLWVQLSGAGSGAVATTICMFSGPGSTPYDYDEDCGFYYAWSGVKELETCLTVEQCAQAKYVDFEDFLADKLFRWESVQNAWEGDAAGHCTRHLEYAMVYIPYAPCQIEFVYDP
jgi:hypothetical protein